MNDEHKDHKNSLSDFDFERSSYISEIDFEKDTDDSDFPLEMLRLLTNRSHHTKRSQSWLI